MQNHKYSTYCQMSSMSNAANDKGKCDFNHHHVVEKLKSMHDFYFLLKIAVKNN